MRKYVLKKHYLTANFPRNQRITNPNIGNLL